MCQVTRNRLVVVATIAVAVCAALSDDISAGNLASYDRSSARVDAEHYRYATRESARLADAPPIELPAATSPLGVVLRLGEAYSHQAMAEYAIALTSDFRFTFGDPESRDRYPNGFTRQDEIISAKHLFEGFIDRDGVDHPGADRIEVRMDSMVVGADTEKPDSSEYYQVVVVHRGSLRIELGNGETIDVGPQRHVLHCVRGDAAHLSPGQPADAGRWYIHRWIEAGEAESSESLTAVDAPARIQLVVRPIENPTRAPVSITLSLPNSLAAALDVLDVAGRRVLRRDLAGFQVGTHRVEIEGARQLRPGVYWLRLSQAARASISRMVIIP